MEFYLQAFITCFFLLYISIANSHGGRQDSVGGHFNRKTNVYHCHKEPCFSIHRKSRDALQKAKQERRAFSSMYNRKDWPHWIDEDSDCQNTRAETLISASNVSVKFKRNKGCVVSHGEWFDPYSNKTFTAASKLDIDHVIPLKEAYISGGDSWTRQQRRIFANDPDNLIVVSASENREKGAKDPANWLPDTIEYRCEYVQSWMRIKAKYNLDIDAKERNAIDTVLAACN